MLRTTRPIQSSSSNQMLIYAFQEIKRSLQLSSNLIYKAKSQNSLQNFLIMKQREKSINLKSSNSFQICSGENLLQIANKRGYCCKQQDQTSKDGKWRNDRQQNFQTPYDQSLSPAILSTIGLIHANWKDQNGKILSINYGTGFAINRKIIVTCLHNIYSKTFKRLPSQIIFIPGLDGRVNKNHRQYKCRSHDNIGYSEPNQSLDYSPQKEQLALIQIDEDQGLLEEQEFLPIGQLLDQSMQKELQIVGYPSESYYNCSSLKNVKASRVSLKGKIYQIQNHVINHQLPTRVGHSGSPIIASDSNGNFYIVGIHTHKGIRIQFNSGLYFTKEILQKIYNFQKSMNFFDDRKSKGIMFKRLEDIVQSKFPFIASAFIQSNDVKMNKSDTSIWLTQLKQAEAWGQKPLLLQQYHNFSVYHQQMSKSHCFQGKRNSASQSQTTKQIKKYQYNNTDSNSNSTSTSKSNNSNNKITRIQ